MKWNRTALLLALALALAACADGGSRGTGITTAQGNVAFVRSATRLERSPQSLLARLRDLLAGPRVATAQSAVEGITVRVEGTPLSGVTDTNGFFVLGGDFSGPVILLFQRPSDGTTARIGVSIPAGGVLTLVNLEVDGRSGRANAEREDLSFHGVVLATNCPSETADVVSRLRPQGESYTVRLGGSALRDSQGAPLPCTALQGGTGVRVAGVVNRDGTISAVEARVENESSGSGEGGGDDDGASDDDEREDISPPNGDGEEEEDETDDDGGPGSDSDDSGSGSSDDD